MPKVIFSIGITTFNRQEQLKHNLEVLSKVDKSIIESVYIINQGSDLGFDVNTILSQAKEIKQPNLGGAGGFTRTILCFLDKLGCSREPTHHIIMDDDASFDVEIFSKAAQICALNPSSCFGGHMCRPDNPDLIAEIGVKINNQGEWLGLGREIFSYNLEAQDLFNNKRELDAHAWWFWIAPRVALEKVGLPLPIFIKGDDIEYTYRCKNFGYVTKSSKYLSIIHPALHHKKSNWQFFYLARNQAIMASVSRDLYLSRFYALYRISACLVRHEYFRAELEIEGIKAFLRGPDTLFLNGPRNIHIELCNFVHKLDPPEKMKIPKDCFIENPSQANFKDYFYGAVVLFFKPAMKNSKVLWDTSMPPNPRQIGTKRYLRPTNNFGVAECFPFSRKRYLLGLLKMIPLVISFLINYKRVSLEWQQSFKKITSRQFWEEQFEVNQ